MVFPNYWPYVRRGAERLMAEYATYASSTGHRVDIITSKPGRARVVASENLTIYYEAQHTHPVLARHWFGFRFYSFTYSALRRLLAEDYDVAHIWLPTYGIAARLARRIRHTPYLYQCMTLTQEWPGPFGHSLIPQVIG